MRIKIHISSENIRKGYQKDINLSPISLALMDAGASEANTWTGSISATFDGIVEIFDYTPELSEWLDLYDSPYGRRKVKPRSFVLSSK